MESILARINVHTDLAEAVADADMAIESIVERLDVKQSVWRSIEEHAPQKVIFVANTSGLGPTAIQRVLRHPERFVVAHFWNPAHLMPMVEVELDAYIVRWNAK